MKSEKSEKSEKKSEKSEKKRMDNGMDEIREYRELIAWSKCYLYGTLDTI